MFYNVCGGTDRLKVQSFHQILLSRGSWYQPYLSSQLAAHPPFLATHPDVFPGLRTKEKPLPFKVHSKSMGNKQIHPQRRKQPSAVNLQSSSGCFAKSGVFASAKLIHKDSFCHSLSSLILHLLGTDCKTTEFRFKKLFPCFPSHCLLFILNTPPHHVPKRILI